MKQEDIQKAKNALNEFYIDTERMATKLPMKDRVYDWMNSYMVLQKFIRGVEADIKKRDVESVDKPVDGGAVEHPSHYQTESGLECIEVMREVFGDEAIRTFAVLNAFKYLWRSGKKAGEPEDKDIRKAAYYLGELATSKKRDIPLFIKTPTTTNGNMDWIVECVKDGLKGKSISTLN